MGWGSGIRNFFFIPDPKTGAKKAPDPVFGYAHCLASYYYYMN
jgi:hypothetical protein